MAARLRIAPLDRAALVAPGAALSPEAAAAAVAAFARGEVAASAALNAAALGHPVPHRDAVGGVPDAPYEAVRPGESILAVFDLATDVLAWIAAQLQKHAPVRSGAYAAAVAIFADGTRVATPAEARDAEEVVFTSLVPYARKIERGASRQAPDGVFQAVAALAAARYGNSAAIRFAYREPVGGADALEDWAGAHAARAEGAAKQRRQYLKNVRQPAVVVRFR